jgi:hypothetical protein
MVKVTATSDEEEGCEEFEPAAGVIEDVPPEQPTINAQATAVLVRRIRRPQLVCPEDENIGRSP